MIDWEYFGSRKAWMAIGAGILLMVLGSAMMALGVRISIAGIPVFIGVLAVGISAYYLAFWENWLLLGRKKDV